MRNLAGLQDSGAPYFVNMMIRPESASLLSDSVSFLISRGVRRVQFSWAIGVEWGKSGPESLQKALSEARAVCEARGVEVLNRHNHAEPTVLTGQLLLDVDGVVSTGAWPVLERLLPRLAGLSARGHVRTLERLPLERRGHRDQMALLLAAADTPEQKRVLLENMSMGLRMGRYWDGLHEDAAPAARFSAPRAA